MNYRIINTDRQFKATTGYSKDEFKKLALDYRETYTEVYGRIYEDYIEKSVMEQPKLETLEDALFFVLYQMKNDLIFDSLGATFKMSGGAAHKNFKYFISLLEITLEKKSNAQTKI